MRFGRRDRRGSGVIATLMVAVAVLAGCGAGGSPGSVAPTSTPAAAVKSPSAGCGARPTDAYSQAVLADAPLAYFRLDETGGPAMCDASAAAASGTYAGGVQFGVPGAVPGDGAVAAVGPGAGVGTGGAAPALTGDHSFTLEAWFRVAGTARDQSLVDLGQPGEGNVAGLSAWTSDAGKDLPIQLVLDLYVGVANAGTLPIWDTTAAGVNLWDGQWHALVITYSADTNTVTGYVDAHDLGTQTPVAAIDLLASPVRIGYWVDTYINEGVIGDLDEVAVYPTALSQARVVAHYQASGR